LHAVVAIGMSCVCHARPALAEENSGAAELIRAQIAAGEFAPARRLAEQATDRGQHDAWLGQISRAQSQAGARSASLGTAAEIYDDRARSSAITENPPAGGARGGAQAADFASLIELITTTIAPTSWDETGGPGAIHEFRGGVFVDAEGVLRPLLKKDHDDALASLHRAALAAGRNQNARRQSELRKVSLTRLEKQVQLLAAAGRAPTEEMAMLAGLEKISYVLVYPDSGDIVLAGPADNWQTNGEGRLVAQTSGRPVLQLDDFVVILRHLLSGRQAQFGCSITPTEKGLASTQAFLDESKKTPLKPGTREAWLKQLREHMGRQEITVDGIDPRTRAGRVLVEADYHMKLIGMGLADGTPGVKDYLSQVQVPKGGSPPPMDVLRWWFTLNYEAVRSTEQRDAFELRGQGVQVLSENELLTALGKRVHTGKSDALNSEFAQSFTKHFPALATKYPVYAELRNLFDMALVCALIKAEDLGEHSGWHMTCFRDPKQYRVTLGPAPRTVETVVNHRVINRVHVIAGVSGGVSVDPWSYVEPSAVKIDDYGALKAQRKTSVPTNLAKNAWWWD